MSNSTRILLIAVIAAGALYWWKHRSKNSNSQDGSYEGGQPLVEEQDASGIDADGQGSSWDSQFDQSNHVTARKGAKVEYFEAAQPTDASTQEDDWALYNSDQYLPQEKVDDWFQTVQVPQTVKNQHLLQQPLGIGINTVGNSKRIMNLDIRPVPYCPKFAVSPWGNSSYEPSTNRSRALC